LTYFRIVGTNGLVENPWRLVITEQGFAAQGTAVLAVIFWIRWLREHALKAIQIEFSHYFTSFFFRSILILRYACFVGVNAM
jgi:hypothetical protein